jgi:glyoxylase-like metal-dependent hydrolase (beta-lactamase superfamily II)
MTLPAGEPAYKENPAVVRRLALVILCAAALTGTAWAQDAKTVIASAQKALGGVTSITYSGSARDVSFQQCGANATDMQCRGLHDPMRPISNYVRVIDLSGPTTRHTGGTNNIGAGGSTTVAPGTFFQQVTPQQADVSQPWQGSLDLYLTPWGFLKGAADNNASVAREGRSTVLTWSPKATAPSGKAYQIKGYLNSQNQVERVETWLGENIMGDMHIVATYSGWKDFGGGAIAPARIVQTRGGWPFFETTVTAARANPSDLASLAAAPAPPAGRGGGGPPAGGGRAGGPPPAITVTAEKLGDGLFRLNSGAGSYDTLLVEFKDHVMMLEAGQPEARALAYIAETKKMYPNKPIRYVVNTHAHADHTGGLPAMVAEGSTIITHENNVKFLETALNTPRTLLADTLAKNPKKARVEGVGSKKVYSDGNRTVELYHIWPAPHSNGLIVAYIPKEKILFQGDFSLPAKTGEPANDHVKALGAALDKLKLDYTRYINVHASAEPQTKADVDAAVAARRAADAKAGAK